MARFKALVLAALVALVATGGVTATTDLYSIDGDGVRAREWGNAGRTGAQYGYGGRKPIGQDCTFSPV